MFKAYLQRYQTFVRRGLQLMDAGRGLIQEGPVTRNFLETNMNLAMANFAAAAQDWVMLHMAYGRHGR